MPGAAALAVIGFMEAASISASLASRQRERIHADREFLGLGFANVASGLFGGYPVAAGFSRSAVNVEAGARTKLAGLITASTVAVVLMWLTSLLHDVPKASLGAIIG